MKNNNTLYNKVYQYVKENPTSDNKEIALNLNTNTQTISVYLTRLEQRGKISILNIEGKRFISTFKEHGDYKKEILETMLDNYIEDFEEANSYTERLEIGKMILRLWEKI